MSATGFVIVRGAGRNTPRLVCERCGEVIDEADMSGVIHTREKGSLAAHPEAKLG